MPASAGWLIRAVLVASSLVLVVLWPPRTSADTGSDDPLHVVTAYARAMAARDAPRVAEVLSDDVAFGDYFCCADKARYVATLPAWWAAGVSNEFTDFAVSGDTVTVRQRNAYETDLRDGIPPVAIVYTMVVRDGKIVSARGELDWGQERYRNAVLNSRWAAAMATVAASVPTAVPEDSTRPRSGVDTQQRRTPSPAAWIAAVSLTLASVVLACAIQRPNRRAAA